MGLVVITDCDHPTIDVERAIFETRTEHGGLMLTRHGVEPPMLLVFPRPGRGFVGEFSQAFKIIVGEPSHVVHHLVRLRYAISYRTTCPCSKSATAPWRISLAMRS